jgi:uncharacterized protein
MKIQRTRDFFKQAIVATLLLGCASFASAQANDAKTQLAKRVIAAQDGAEMERMFEQLADTAVQPLVQKWGERLTALPANKQQSTTDVLDGELKKFNADLIKLISTQATKERASSLPAAYTAKFSEEELKQLVALMEAPVFKKYQTIAPELGSTFVKAIVDGSRSAVEARSKAFDDKAASVLGSSGAAPAKKP